jgi:hypothetical protein
MADGSTLAATEAPCRGVPQRLGPPPARAYCEAAGADDVACVFQHPVMPGDGGLGDQGDQGDQGERKVLCHPCPGFLPLAEPGKHVPAHRMGGRSKHQVQCVAQRDTEFAS